MLKKLYNQSGVRVLHGIFEAKFLRRQGNKKGLNLIDSLNTDKYKTSDTLFILGSGYSVTKLTKQDWSYVKKHDSIGFNSWVFNDFTPTYYCMETPMKSLHFNAMIDEFNKKHDLYENVPFIVQYQHFLKSANHYEALKLPKRNIYYNIPMMPNTTSKGILSLLLRWWEKAHRKEMSWLLHYAGSLSYLVSMGYIMGYKKIVLLGVDLNDSRYFFEHPEANEASKEYSKIHNQVMNEMNRTGTKKKHDTINPKITQTYGCLPIDHYLYEFNEILKKKGVVLSVENKESRLTEGLPTFNFPS